MIDYKSIDHEVGELMHKPMTPGNIDMLAKLHQARQCVGAHCTELDPEDAKKWGGSMNPGAKWTQDQTTAVMRQRGYDYKPMDFWVAMNAMYSDYGKVGAKHNMDKPEFWADMADAFLSDPDARKGKLARYYWDIVEH